MEKVVAITKFQEPCSNFVMSVTTQAISPGVKAGSKYRKKKKKKEKSNKVSSNSIKNNNGSKSRIKT